MEKEREHFKLSVVCDEWVNNFKDGKIAVMRPPCCSLVTSKDQQRRGHSQLQDEDDLRLVLKDLVQGDDVGVVNLLQDVHLTLDVLPGHATATRLAAPLLDELGGKLHTRASVSASSDHGELTAGRRRWERKKRR